MAMATRATGVAMSSSSPNWIDSQALKVRGRAHDAAACGCPAAGYKSAIVDAVRMVPGEIENAARENRGRGQQNAGLQKPADDGFEAAIVHRLDTFPVMPFTIISIARARMTTPKTLRSVLTRMCTSNLAPNKAPARTPSITGMATLRVDVSVFEIKSGAGRGGDADHEVAGGSGNLERNAHDAVHGDDFDSAGANAQQARKRARAEHHGEARRDIAHAVGLGLAVDGIGAAQPQPPGQRIRCDALRSLPECL